MLGELLPISDHLKDIRETRFADGFSCPHCGGEKVKRNGTYSGRQRYLCHSCMKTFNDWTGTPMAGTHYPDRWMEYIQLMLEGITLKQCAKALEISIPTAFYWWHKVLNALPLAENPRSCIPAISLWMKQHNLLIQIKLG
jgi:transposase-like protein